MHESRVAWLQQTLAQMRKQIEANKPLSDKNGGYLKVDGKRVRFDGPITPAVMEIFYATQRINYGFVKVLAVPLFGISHVLDAILPPRQPTTS